MKPPATDVDLGGDDDWVPPGEPTEAAATPRPAVATSTPPKQEPVEWLFYTECGNHARARRRRKAQAKVAG